MKTIKVGQINFYINDIWGDTGAYRINLLCDKLNTISNNKYEYVDCKKDEADIVFYSLYGHLNDLKLVKGNPLFIYWTDEHLCSGADEIWDNPFEYYRNGNLSVSFYDDSETNLFFPYSMQIQFLDDYADMKQYFNNSHVGRNKFCTFCASNDNVYNAKYRTKMVEYISKQYKQITCCGRVLNNTNGEYLPWDVKERFNYHKKYKFNLCFENAYTNGNIIYFTEKMMNAFINNVIPIYWGAERVIEIINPNAFINCNGLNKEEILKKIIEVDNDNELYDYMINQPIFVHNEIDYSTYYIEKMNKFIIDHL